MKTRDRLKRVLELARRAKVSHRLTSAATGEEKVEAPLGFSTRVAARWAAERPARGNLWERLCWFGAAASIAICFGASMYQSSLPEPTAFDELIDAPMIETEMF